MAAGKIFFNLIEFVKTRTVAVVPVNWVNNNEVKWNDKLSPSFAKKGFFPKNKWKTFEVKVITSKIFDSYQEAEKAMSKVLKLNKTVVDTDDVVSEVEKAASPILSSSPDDTDDENPLKIVKFKTGTKNIPSPRYKTTPRASSSSNIFTTIPASNVKDVYSTVEKVSLRNNSCTEIAHEETIFTDNQFPMENESNNNDIPTGDYVVVQESTLTLILLELKNVKETLETIKKHVTEGETTAGNCSCKKIKLAKTRCSKLLPFRDIESVNLFENEILGDESLITDFQNFLSNQITSKDLRSFVRITVNKVYSLELQGQINYTGAKGKKKLKDLLSTEVILRTICESVPELILIQDETEKIGKAEAEFKYQLQHYYDRQRSTDRKNANQNKI